MEINGPANGMFAYSGAADDRPAPRGAGLRAVGAGLLLLAVGPVLLVLGLAWHVAQKNMTQRVRDDVAAVSALIVAQQAQLVEGTRQLLIAVSASPTVVAGDWAACNAYLQQLGARLPNYVSVGVLDASGQLVCRSSAAAGPVNLSDRPYVRQAIESGDFTVGDFVVGRVTGSKTVPFALPVHGAGGAVHGVAFVGMDLRFLHQRLHAVPLPAGVSALVSDSRGTVLAASGEDYSLVGSLLPEPALLAAVAAGNVGELATQGAGGAAWLHQVHQIPVAPQARLYVSVSAATGELLAPATRELGLLVAAVLVFMLLYAALIGAVGARWAVNPLRQLVHAMRLIERGRYRGEAIRDDSRVREVHELQRGLQAMWQGLQLRGRERDEALAESDAARTEMREVLNQMDDGFMILGRDWRVKFCNQRGARLVELPGDATGELFWDLFPDERRRSRRARCEKEVGAGRSWQCEDFHARYGRWFEIRFFPAKDGIGVFLRDATEHWKMTRELMDREQRYRELFEANPNVMWIFDVETLRFLAVNQTAVDRYGYSREEFLAMSITDIGPADDADEMAEQVRRSLAGGGATLRDSPRIWRHVTKAGEMILVEVTRHQLTFENRLAQLSMVTDATARLIGESRLRTQVDKLTRRAGSAENALMASRQLLLGHVGLVHEEVLPLLRRAMAQPALAADAARVEQLLGEVLRLTQVTRAPFQPQAVDLAELAQAHLAQLRERDPGRQVHVEIEPQLACQGDEPLLAALVAALLDNAWKFSARRPDAWIRMGRLERSEGPQAYYVSDNGIGFDEAQQGRLYLPFERLHSAAEYPGHGLGLATARAVVERHGGRLWARSMPGQGATFCFELEPQPEESLMRVSEVVIDSLAEIEE